MSYETLLYQIDGPILTVTLNRPDKLNAYTAVMGVELADAFHRADADDAVRVVIVTGAGRGFCAGADISGGAAAFDADAKGSVAFAAPGKARQEGGGFVEAIFACRKPSIAAINGAAVGVGATLTLPMDIRIASSTAKLGFIFARRGLVPEAGSAWFLPKLVGLPQALRWCLSGALITADDAKAGGLVGEVLEPDRLLARAREIALEIAENTAPVSIALARQMLWRFSGAPDPWGLLKVDGPLSMELGAGPDVREGVGAFLEKRPPRFPGRVSSDMPAAYPWWDEA
ncbi:MAG: enoyl-CoA hydratase/isomerase family protein [Alphaproteobacteria bacterium]|nr:enoyl-CoA hydratase/isomerase family protein [Alphaproteobacteria bacterium]MBU1514433.1 enoyl-CoA hydratase/isomerase family protein [Alphaproteobacteria bacterium]MBU2097086.1 enoyl-CoA hydratase/isomerase family protein [Alphaproteobacteria bacterium]MBU2153565.1 enoyl-CoA hydratase/isomerase family protein [Alphaproteobacteria bacterium]MBU2308632.1 enoyl-CoA hydratase/isomerase family protein [Alphaproteobacteria bacterium]